MSEHVRIPGDSVYNQLVIAPAELFPHLVARGVPIPDQAAEGEPPIGRLLTACEQQFGLDAEARQPLSGIDLQTLSALAMTAGQEGALAYPEEDDRLVAALTHVPQQRNPVFRALQGTLKNFGAGRDLPTSGWAAMLNLVHPDMNRNGIGLLAPIRGSVDHTGKPLSASALLRQQEQVAQAIAATARRHFEKFPVKTYGISVPLGSPRHVAAILEARLYDNGNDWLAGARVTPRLAVSRAARLVAGVKNTGLRGLRHLPQETRAAYERARDALDSDEGRAYQREQAEQRRRLRLH